jgi:hypothetical protein
MYEQKHLFDFMLDRIEEVGSENGLKLPQAFGRWFAGTYFDKPHDFSISDGSGDGKVGLFFQTNNGKEVDHYILNTKFTQKYNAAAPVAFYDEINRFWQAFANTANRNEYLTSVVRPELRPKYKKLFEYYDNGNAQLFFVTNHRQNEQQYRYLEDAMPRTPALMLTGINTVLSADKSDTRAGLESLPLRHLYGPLLDLLRQELRLFFGFSAFCASKRSIAEILCSDVGWQYRCVIVIASGPSLPHRHQVHAGHCHTRLRM